MDKLTKLVRQVNRLETRVNKLESNMPLVNQTDDPENNTNMYMI